jgi:hypothetical protein
MDYEPSKSDPSLHYGFGKGVPKQEIRDLLNEEGIPRRVAPWSIGGAIAGAGIGGYRGKSLLGALVKGTGGAVLGGFGGLVGGSLLEAIRIKRGLDKIKMKMDINDAYGDNRIAYEFSKKGSHAMNAFELGITDGLEKQAIAPLKYTLGKLLSRGGRAVGNVINKSPFLQNVANKVSPYAKKIMGSKFVDQTLRPAVHEGLDAATGLVNKAQPHVSGAVGKFKANPYVQRAAGAISKHPLRAAGIIGGAGLMGGYMLGGGGGGYGGPYGRDAYGNPLGMSSTAASSGNLEKVLSR